MKRGRGAEAGRDREAGPFCGSVPSATALFSSGGGPVATAQFEAPSPVPPRLARGAASALGTPATVRGLGPPPPPRQGGRETRRPTRSDPSRPVRSGGWRAPPPPSPWRRSTCSCRLSRAPGPSGTGRTAPAARAGSRAPREHRSGPLLVGETLQHDALASPLFPPPLPCTVGQPSASAHLLCADGRVNRLSHPRPENGTTPPAQGAGRKEKGGGAGKGRT